nr:adenylate/guanylate cyclase domain-containing protein [Armatimonas rosea]
MLQRLLQDADHTAHAYCDNQSGVVLFADISGFTAISERLAEQGSAGVEELSSLLNGYFSHLTQLVVEHGGDVVKFAGDGLLAYWPDQPTSLSQAVHCGSRIQEHLRDNAARNASLRLSLRIGIGVGEVFAASVGGEPDHWEFVLGGEAVQQSYSAQRQAEPGQVVLSPEALSQYQPPLGVPTPLPVEAPASLERLPAAARGYVPRPVLARLESGQGEWLAELRRVSALFIHLPTLDLHADFARAQAVIQGIQRVLSELEGVVTRVGVDGQGITVLAAFGLPPLAHEDDATRAVRAALGVAALAESAGLVVSVGVATGPVFCGAIGSSQRCEYTMLGDTINVAARIMAAGQGVRCESTTMAACAHTLRFNPLGSLSIRGRSEPVVLGEPQAFEASAAPSRTVSLVGRHAEQRRFTERLEAGRGGLILVEGEAGIGKSCLVAHFLEQAQAKGVPTLLGAGDSIGRATLYGAWRSVFTQIFGAAATDAAAVLTHLSPSQQPLAPLLGVVLPVELPDNATTAMLVGRDRSEATLELLVSLLRRHAVEQHLLLVMEDAHWFDSASWALLLRVVEQLEGLLIVVDTRPLLPPYLPEYEALRAHPSTDFLQLQALSGEDIAQVVAECLGVHELPEVVVRLIQQKAEGHPFFSEELAYALRDAGMIQISQGVCRLAPDAPNLLELAFPDTVQGVITSRIDRLSPQQQFAIKVASVVGRLFTLRTLSAIYPLSQDVPALPHNLEELSRLDLTPRELTLPEQAYLFKHVLTQEVAYSLMLATQRQPLHHAIALWYEQTYASDLTPHYSVLAYHWNRVVETGIPTPEALPKAILYAQKSGDQALRSNALLEAIGHFSSALSLLARLPESAERDSQELSLQVSLAIPLTLTRGWAAPEVGAAYQRAQVLIQRVGEAPQLFPTLVGVLTYYLVRGQYDDALAMAQHNLEVALRLGDPELLLEAEHDLGAVHFYRGEIAQVRPHMDQVHALFDSERHYHHIFLYGKNPGCVAHVHLGLTSCLEGDLDQALQEMQAATALTESWPHPFSRLWSFCGEALVRYARGETQELAQLAGSICELANQNGFPNWLAQGLVYLGSAQVRLGSHAEGLAAMQQGIGLWAMTGSELLRPFLLSLLAEGQQLAGQPDAARATLQEAIAQVERTGERWWEPELYRRLGTLAPPDEAQGHYQKAHALATARGVPLLVQRTSEVLKSV